MAAAGVLAGAAPEAAQVALDTAFGQIVLTLDTRRAPLSSGAFLAAIDQGSYTNGTFTRVVRPDNDHGSPPIAVVQGGARTEAGLKPIAHESTRQTGLHHLDGTLSLPRDGVGTATGGEFFICIGDQPGLDFGGARNHDGQGFAAFGQVTAGMGIVRRIWAMDASGPSSEIYTKGQMLRVPVPILRATRLPAPSSPHTPIFSTKNISRQSWHTAQAAA
jgi:peptidyl-prolyl cis-trans isomerase A (cyclophilin A)